MAIVPNYLTLQYTESNNGNILNHAYHDFVLSMGGLSDYQQNYPNITGFKYVLSVWHDTEGKLIEMKIPPNNFGQGLFNTRSIFEDITKTDESGYASKRKGKAEVSSTHAGVRFIDAPHAIHQIDRFARNRQNLRRVYFGTSAEFFSNGVFNTVNLGFPKTGSKGNLLPFYMLWNGCLHHRDEQRGLLTYTRFILNSSAGRFLTNKRAIAERSVTIYDYETLAFINGRFQVKGGGHGGSSYIVNEWSQVKDIEINAQGDNAFNMIIPNTEANCGSYAPLFDSPYPNLQSPYTDEGLLYVGVGPKNLINNGLLDTNGNAVTENTMLGITRYFVQARKSNGSPASELIKFTLNHQDCKYETIRLAYLNRLGGYDYISLNKKSVNRTEITRSNYKANYGYSPLQYNNVNQNNHWDYGSYEGGTRSYNVNAIETIEANSDFLNEQDARYLLELFTSPVCYIQRGDEFEPCVVTEKDYTLQTTDNDKLKQYVVQIQLGNEQRVQRL